MHVSIESRGCGVLSKGGGFIPFLTSTSALIAKGAVAPSILLLLKRGSVHMSVLPESSEESGLKRQRLACSACPTSPFLAQPLRTSPAARPSPALGISGDSQSSGDFVVATLTLSTLPLLIPVLRITKYSDLATVFPA